MKVLAVVCVAGLVALATPLTVVKDGPIDMTPGQLPYHEQLDDNYSLKWNFNSSHIVFEVNVKTNGYIGFGISGNGAMYPSDVIIGWVSNGKTHFGDRHGSDHIMPALDTSQDWQLLSGQESGSHTTLTMIRKLDTCDSQDMAIKEGTTRVIYSYSPTDPASDDSIAYHGSNRGTKSLLLLDPPSKERNSKPLPSDATSIDFLNKNYTIPGKDTTYSCTLWKLQNLKEKHHMIRYEPVVQKGNEKIVHHIIVYFCDHSFPDSFIGTRYECNHSPREAHSCKHVFLAWAIGGTVFNYPDHVGHSLGAVGDPVYFQIETHYDNPTMRSDIVDNSGIRIHLTKQLRQYDAGILEAGVGVSGNQIIPPYNSDFLSQGFCHPECISEGLGNSEIKVFANMLHAHLLGSKLRTRHIRNGVELPPLQEDNSYDFNFQEQRMLPEERVVKKGDALIVECEYDSSQRTTVTYGGLSTRQEMCLSFSMYYPQVPLGTCLSVPEYKIPPQYAGQSVHSIVSHLDWTRQDIQDGFKETLQQSPVHNICRGGHTHFHYNLQITPTMNITKTYNPPKTCHN